MAREPYQDRVVEWAIECFGKVDALNESTRPRINGHKASCASMYADPIEGAQYECTCGFAPPQPAEPK